MYILYDFVVGGKGIKKLPINNTLHNKRSLIIIFTKTPRKIFGSKNHFCHTQKIDYFCKKYSQKYNLQRIKKCRKNLYEKKLILQNIYRSIIISLRANNSTGNICNITEIHVFSRNQFVENHTIIATIICFWHTCNNWSKISE